MENTWLAQAKRLQALASTGLHFCTDDFERERLEEIAEIAHSMLAQLGNVPLERISGLVPDFAQRYSTPMIDVRGAVIDGERILLVREGTDGCWALPGGYADIGLSAAENIVKEIREEAGLTVTAVRYHSSQPWPFPSQLMIGLICEVDSGDARPDQTELEAVAWLTRDEARACLAGRPPAIKAPPRIAIARTLLQAWVDGFEV